MNAPPDFSTSVSFGDTVFGFVAFRDQTFLQAGKEGFWLHVPSWLFAVGVLALALAEWAVVRFVFVAAWRKWRSRRSS